MTGEPCALKGASTVRRGAHRNLGWKQFKALGAYPTLPPLLLVHLSLNRLAHQREGFIHYPVFLLCCSSEVVSAVPSGYVPCFSTLCFELLDFLDELLLSLQCLKQHQGMSIQKLE